MSAMTLDSRRTMIPRDSALPQLPLALDPHRMRDLLSGVVAAAGPRPAELSACSIARVKYRPARHCMVLYRARIRDAARGEEREQFFHAGLYAPAEAQRRYEDAMRSVIVPSYGAPVTYHPEHSMVLWAFPNERKLRALHLLANPDCVSEGLLPDLARRRWGAAVEVGKCLLTPVSYVPEHAYTVRVTARLTGPDAPDHDWTVYAKTDSEGRGDATFEAMRALWNSRARREGLLCMARPLAFQAAVSILWQEELPGTPIDRLAEPAGLSSSLAREIGRSVAALHATDVPGLSETGTADICTRLDATTRAVAAVLPHVASRVRALASELIRRPPVSRAGQATLHGDLQLSKLLAHEGRVGLLGFEALRAGPLEAELGSFIAGLLYRPVIEDGSDRTSATAVPEFLSGYRGQSPWRVDLRQVRWHVAASLIGERAWQCLTSLEPGRLGRLGALLELAELWAGDSVTLRLE